jgi:integrase
MAPDEARKLSTTALLAEYVKELERRGCSALHVKRTRERCEFLLEKLPRLGDAVRSTMRAALARVTDRRTKHPREKGEGRLPSPQTVNAYRTALHGFFQWLVLDREVITHNPVSGIRRVKTTGAAYTRRALLPEEFQKLLDGIPDSQYGRERRVVYLLASSTGLRRGELGALLVGSLDLDAELVVLPGSKTKNRDEARLALSPATVEALRPFVEGREREEPLFRAVPLVATLREDLARVGLQDEEGGDRFDFHSLRVQFITDGARAGIPLAQMQKLARHSTPTLTANVYTRLEIHDAREAVRRLDAVRSESGRAKEKQKSENDATGQKRITG